MSDDRSRKPWSEEPHDGDEAHEVYVAEHDDDPRDGFMGFRNEEEMTEEEVAQEKKSRRNTLIMTLSLLCVAVLVCGGILGTKFGIFDREDYSGDGNGTQVQVTVQQGEGNDSIAQDLQDKNVVANAKYFSEQLAQRGSDEFIQPGTFTLQEKMSTDAALKVLLGEDENYVAVNQTKRKDETFQTLSKGTGISVSEFQALDKDPGQFGIPSKFPSLEGWLHPGEYRFKKDATAKEIVQEMVDKTKADLKTAGVSGDDRIFHVLTVASILEFEATPKDYSAVAGAIENRIDNPEGETSGYLQSDATVAYGLGKKTYEISTQEKQDASNKYNTFANKGLPEGPIGSPALTAIQAAANPQKNDYYFWVTVNLDTGETKFAKTYAEHQKNVQQYQNWCSDNSGKCS